MKDFSKKLDALKETDSLNGVNCYSLRGYEIEGEKAEDKKEEKQYTVDYSRMKMLRQAYENGEEYDPDSEEGRALGYFRACAEKLKKYGDAYEVKCLSCRNFVRLLNDAREDSNNEDETDNMSEVCHSSCSDSHQKLDLICQPEVLWLMDYYVVEV